MNFDSTQPYAQPLPSLSSQQDGGDYTAGLLGEHDVEPMSETSCLNPVVSVVKSLAGGIILLAMIVALPSAIAAHHFDSSVSLTYTWIAIPITLVGGRLAYLWYKRSKEEVVVSEEVQEALPSPAQLPVKTGPFEAFKREKMAQLSVETTREVERAQCRYHVNNKPIVANAATICQQMLSEEVVSEALPAANNRAEIVAALSAHAGTIQETINACQRGRQHQPYEYEKALSQNLNIKNAKLKSQVIEVVLYLIHKGHFQAFKGKFPTPNDVYSVQNSQWANVVCQQYGLSGGRVMQPFFNYDSTDGYVELKFLYASTNEEGHTTYVPVHAAYIPREAGGAEIGQCYAIKHPPCDTPQAAQKMLRGSEYVGGEGIRFTFRANAR